MAYSVSDLSTSPATYPHAVSGAQSASSSVERKNLRVAPVGSVTATEDVKAHYTEIFNNHAKVQNNLLKQLNDIFGKNIPMDGNRHVNFTDFIKDVCVDSDQANDAYKFYGRQIIEQINQLGDYILKARALLNQATADMPQWIIDQLDILDGFSKEMNDTFGFRYIYDLNEDIWKLYEDDYADATHTQFHDDDPNAYKSYDKLRTMKVEAYKKQEYQKDPAFDKKTIEVFNELNLLDRLKYIKLYYDVDSGKTDALFPNDKIRGVPTVKEASKTDVLAAIEPFFMGYLIDRDGPVNAVASYLEVKSAALVEKINIESKKIKALNVYLKFIQRALDILNASQSSVTSNDKGEIPADQRHRIPDGAMVALMYLCGGNMYNLFEAANGTKCLVIESNTNPGSFLLVPEGTEGMRCLVGDSGTDNSYAGNCHFPLKKNDNGVWELQDAPFAGSPRYHYWSSKIDDDTHRYNEEHSDNGKIFSLPTQIECEKILPNSVRKYADFNNAASIDKPDILQSWQKAFQDKLSFIQTSIDTVNTDIKVFRNKVDTLNTLSNTFRNRTHTAYMKIASNLRK